MKRANTRSVSYSFKKITEILQQYGIDNVTVSATKPGLVFEFECSDPVLLHNITVHCKLACGSKFSFMKECTSFFVDANIPTTIINIKK